MSTKSMSYDHPCYTAVYRQSTGQINGSAGVSTKFSAFTSLIIKSVTISATTTATSADVIQILAVRNGAGTNTTTNTVAYGTMGSGSFFGNFWLTGTSQVALNQGDVWWVQKGTDATGTYVADVELVVAPLASVSV